MFTIVYMYVCRIVQVCMYMNLCVHEINTESETKALGRLLPLGYKQKDFGGSQGVQGIHLLQALPFQHAKNLCHESGNCKNLGQKLHTARQAKGFS